LASGFDWRHWRPADDVALSTGYGVVHGGAPSRGAIA
jgi:hypothetical protein